MSDAAMNRLTLQRNSRVKEVLMYSAAKNFPDIARSFPGNNKTHLQVRRMFHIISAFPVCMGRLKPVR
jgi:hypothetical protein